MPTKGNGVATAGTGQRGRKSGSPDFAHAGVPTTEQVAEEKVLGKPGKPLNQRSPFTIGLTAAVGVMVAYLLFRMLADTEDRLVAEQQSELVLSRAGNTVRLQDQMAPASFGN